MERAGRGAGLCSYEARCPRALAELLVQPCLPSVPGVKVDLTFSIESSRLRKSVYTRVSSYALREQEVSNVYTAACSAALSFQDPLERSQMIQWLFFWHGSGAPPYGQLWYFSKFAKDKNPAAIERFRNETLRVFGVLELHLSGKNSDGQPREYLAGSGKGRYSLADIGAYPWVAKWEVTGFEKKDMEAFPSVLAWLERIEQRDAVKIGTGDKYQKKP